MTRWSDAPEQAAAALIAGALDELQPTWGQANGADTNARSVLLAEAMPAFQALLQQRGLAVQCWHRRVRLDQPAQMEPPPGPFDAALLRLPKSREEQRMAAHQCLGTLAPHGRLIVYGGNDEGIRSFQKNLAELGVVETLLTRGHGRILQLLRADVTVPLRPRLADWRETYPGAGGSKPWISYPGLFAGGAPDAGTALLLRHLPAIAADACVLDYGCGPGAISAAIRARMPDTPLTVLDNDTVALLAAAENLPDATTVLGSTLTGLPKFDLIVSNPPLHAGFMETTAPLMRLIADAPLHLTPAGALVIVVQRRIALDTALAAAFGTVETLADDGRYRVWLARGKRPAERRTKLEHS